MSEQDYVTQGAWLRNEARADAIDDVADQFERPATQGAEAFWSPASPTRWPETPLGWNSDGLRSTTPALQPN
jgi:hypothetical protein